MFSTLFHAFRMDRNYCRGAGLIALVSFGLPHSAFIGFLSMSADYELFLVNIHLRPSPLYSLVNAYFQKGFSSSHSLNSLLAFCHPPFVIGGDFNTHHVVWRMKTDSCVTNIGATSMRRGITQSAIDFSVPSSNLRLSSRGSIDCGSSSNHYSISFGMPLLVSRILRATTTYVNLEHYT